MPRSVAPTEWIGRNDDAMPSNTVRRRLRDGQGNRCATCGVQFGPGVVAHCDHILPLIDFGENRESNLQMLCSDCHKAKTKAEAAQRAHDRAVRDKHTLARPPSSFPQRPKVKAPPQRKATSPLSDKFANLRRPN